MNYYPFIIFIVAYLLHSYCLYYLSNTMKNKYSEDTFLRDNIQEVIPTIKLGVITDYACTIIMLIVIYLSIKHNELDKLILIISIILIIKTLSCTLTILPVPNGYKNHIKCNEKFEFKHILFGKCGDLMFSTHTATFLVYILFLMRYGLNKIIGVSIMVLYSLLVIAQKEHYTIDVFMAYFIVYFAYTIII